jgi:hypothetical protein
MALAINLEERRQRHLDPRIEPPVGIRILVLRGGYRGCHQISLEAMPSMRWASRV